MSKLLLSTLLLIACGSAPLTPKPGAVARPSAGVAADPYPECRDSVEVAVWAAGCIERCIPATHPAIVCHGNNEVHAIVARTDLQWVATLEPAAVSGCGVPGYRVWSVRQDVRPPWLMDRDTFSTWASDTTHCTAKPPDGFFETDYFQRRPGLIAYLLNAADELIPAE